MGGVMSMGKMNNVVGLIMFLISVTFILLSYQSINCYFDSHYRGSFDTCLGIREYLEWNFVIFNNYPIIYIPLLILAVSGGFFGISIMRGD